jgi:hypothetical protein
MGYRISTSGVCGLGSSISAFCPGGLTKMGHTSECIALSNASSPSSEADLCGPAEGFRFLQGRVQHRPTSRVLNQETPAHTKMRRVAGHVAHCCNAVGNVCEQIAFSVERTCMSANPGDRNLPVPFSTIASEGIDSS